MCLLDNGLLDHRDWTAAGMSLSRAAALLNFFHRGAASFTRYQHSEATFVGISYACSLDLSLE
jgi:hypothetical protein